MDTTLNGRTSQTLMNTGLSITDADLTLVFILLNQVMCVLNEPGIKDTLIFEIVDRNHCNRMYINTHQLVQLNKPSSSIPYIYSSVIVFKPDQ
jgi:hypothetical protein